LKKHKACQQKNQLVHTFHLLLSARIYKIVRYESDTRIMPINKEALMRYRIIDQCLRNKFKPYPSMEDLLEACESKLGKTFSDSTIQKDIRAMKEDSALGYFAPIRFSRSKQGYYYKDPQFTISAVPLDEKDLNALEFAASMLQQFRGIKMFNQFDYAVDKIFKAIDVNTMLDEADRERIIQFEHIPETKGSEHFNVLLEAIQNRQVVQFVYTKFSGESPKKRCIHPYLLKEYRNRWYLIGMEDSTNRIITFGLDRMAELEVNQELPYRFNFKFDPENYFRHSYGITYFEGKPEKVLLQFDPQQAPYILTQPLHHTQQIVQQTESGLQISLEVGITVELIMDILKYGAGVQVLQPQSLRDEIQRVLSRAVAQYT
jgi:predicted DNA-binding transcriptional regulator YafY